MNVFSILNQKGGCGKTTTAVNLAHALSKKGYRTLLIDFDPQAHTTYSLGIENVRGACEFLEAYARTGALGIDEFIVKRDENLFVLPSSVGLSALEQKLSNRPDKLFIAYKLFSANKSQYDYCIIDCPPNLGMLALNAVFASDHVIIPLMTCTLSYKGLEVLNKVLEMTAGLHPNKLSLLYLLTQYDRRFRYSLDFYDKLRSSLSTKLMRTVIRTNISLREAAAEGKTIYEYKPKARGAQDYTKLAEELMSLDAEQGWARFFLKGEQFKDVYVVGDFNNWTKNDQFKMKKIEPQTWAINLPLKKGKYNYKFLANEKWFNDPYNLYQEDDSFGGKNSVIQIR